MCASVCVCMSVCIPVPSGICDCRFTQIQPTLPMFAQARSLFLRHIICASNM
ncbi:hypothetical protein MHYP_G00303970, partial [Metynnis hypsauchen]